MVYTTYKNCDDWGMVYYCFTRIKGNKLNHQMFIMFHGSHSFAMEAMVELEIV
jgi:hypothetical protein